MINLKLTFSQQRKSLDLPILHFSSLSLELKYMLEIIWKSSRFLEVYKKLLSWYQLENSWYFWIKIKNMSHPGLSGNLSLKLRRWVMGYHVCSRLKTMNHLEFIEYIILYTRIFVLWIVHFERSKYWIMNNWQLKRNHSLVQVKITEANVEKSSSILSWEFFIIFQFLIKKINLFERESEVTWKLSST